MGDDLQGGYTFSGTSPNNVVTAGSLNALANDAAIKASFVHNKAAVTSLAPTDELLTWNAATGQLRKIVASNAITAARGRPGATNLVMNSSGGSTIAITADFVLMRRDSDGTLYLATAYSVTANTAIGVGVNGLDSGTLTTNTWYYVYAISDGTNDRCILTASSLGPVMPTGYIYKCFLGVGKISNASAWVPFRQHGLRVAWNPLNPAGTADAHLNPVMGASPADFTDIAPDVANVFQTVNLANCIPPDVVASVQGIIGHRLTSSGTLRTYGVGSFVSGTTSLAGTGILEGGQMFYSAIGATAPTAFGFTAMHNFNVPVNVSQQMVWAANNITIAGGPLGWNMRITGFELSP